MFIKYLEIGRLRVMNQLNNRISFNEYFLYNKYEINQIFQGKVLFSIEYKKVFKFS